MASAIWMLTTFSTLVTHTEDKLLIWKAVKQYYYSEKVNCVSQLRKKWLILSCYFWESIYLDKAQVICYPCIFTHCSHCHRETLSGPARETEHGVAPSLCVLVGLLLTASNNKTAADLTLRWLKPINMVSWEICLLICQLFRYFSPCFENVVFTLYIDLVFCYIYISEFVSVVGCCFIRKHKSICIWPSMFILL